MKYTLWNMFIDQTFKSIPGVVTKNLEGRTVVVTGANGGIGFETAKHFAKMNPARVIIACRNQKFGDEAATKIKQDTGFSNVEVWLLDLASFASVNAFAEKYEKEGGRLDILVENAATIPNGKMVLTDDGWESVFQVNNLSTSLLALLLLPRMLETAKTHQTTPRLVVVSSGVHFWTKIDDSVIKSENPLKAFGTSPKYLGRATNSIAAKRYYDTKLLNLFFARALADRLRGQPIIVNSVDPGYAYSNLRRNLKGIMAIVDWLMEKAVAITSEQASRQLIYAAVHDPPVANDLRGAYIMQGKISEPSDYVISREGISVQNILWDNLIEELTKVNPDVAQVVKEHLREPPTNTRVY
ncbi:Short-chain dehydrogenase/reductase phmF [Psilocybe cubensis]|uniref:NAD(P)-binding protein n=2 Tax=Psilocybe cubensis TaxID=181762 RepID=A0A8H7XRC1_PSICU|nr:Short-chain dehydrogenase/reductase phmF [Psilocybe cubensis]KAH9477764.1 Short-chain dehydrogenase/reductase phmF [Psilocybe cubensis]